MSDESHGWAAGPAGTPPPLVFAPAGWYPDPWSPGQHRYWDGAAWTSGAFPHGPAPLGTAPGWRQQTLPGAAQPDEGSDSTTPPPPEWATPSPSLNWIPQTPTQVLDPKPASPGIRAKLSSLSTLEFVTLVVVVMLVVGSLATVGGYYAFRHKASPQTATGQTPTLPGPGSTVAPAPSGPDASALESLVLTQADVPSTYVVQPIPDGTTVEGAATLDLCNGNFASESLRRSRLQVAAYDGEGDEVISTEAVIYANPAATQTAFSELQSVAANCPATPVVSPVGEETVTTQFNQAPDGGWPQTAGVTRLAYDFNTTDDTGTTSESVAVYLRRGAALMGLYFSQPASPQVPVAGQTTIEGIVGVFAGRMAKLPSSVVNG